MPPSGAQRLTTALALAIALAIAFGVCCAPAIGSETPEASPVAGLALQVSPAAPEGRLGDPMSYEFEVTNTGGVPVVQIKVTDTVCGDVGTIDVLDPGESAKLSGSGMMPESGEGEATARGTDPQDAEVTASASHSVEPYIAHEWLDLEITMQALESEVAPGDSVIYRLYVRNVSEELKGTVDLVVKDTFDAEEYEVVSAGGGAVGDGSLEWVLDDLDLESGPWVIEYRLRVSPDAEPGGSLDNEARIQVMGERFDVDASNDRDSATVLVVNRESSPVVSSAGESAGTGGASNRVSSNEGEPFLPFTGGPPMIGWWIAASCVVFGTSLRELARQVS